MGYIEMLHKKDQKSFFEQLLWYLTGMGSFAQSQIILKKLGRKKFTYDEWMGLYFNAGHMVNFSDIDDLLTVIFACKMKKALTKMLESLASNKSVSYDLDQEQTGNSLVELGKLPQSRPRDAIIVKLNEGRD